MPQGSRGPDDKPILSLARKSAWSAWLKKNHAASTGVWLRFAKKGSGLTSITYDDALEVALCYGWIDGQARSEDERHWLQKFTPRGKRSLWSKRNVDRANALIASGAMQPAGLAEIDRAKQDGRWDAAYAGPRTATVPDDLKAALARNARARQAFEALDSRNRFAILFRLQTAKKPETRTRRLEQFVAMLARGERLHR